MNTVKNNLRMLSRRVGNSIGTARSLCHCLCSVEKDEHAWNEYMCLMYVAVGYLWEH